MIPWLDSQTPFPPVERALVEPNGLLAAGGDLSPNRLIDAYHRGIFPWYSPGEPILWWSPDPRMILEPAAYVPSRSLRKRLRRGDFEVRLDTAFAEVTDACAATPRHGQNGTWISPAMRRAYLRLHELGWAHSVETWMDGRLTGGLYGIAIGRVFFGESMFAHATDASKVAFAHLCRFLGQAGFRLIDCQMSTAHLASLGAREIPRADFSARLQALTAGAEPRTWAPDGAQGAW